MSIKSALAFVLMAVTLSAQTNQEKQSVYYALYGDWVVLTPVCGWKYISFTDWSLTVNSSYTAQVIPLPGCKFILKGDDFAFVCTIAPMYDGKAVMTLSTTEGRTVVLFIQDADSYIQARRQQVKRM